MGTIGFVGWLLLTCQIVKLLISNATYFLQMPGTIMAMGRLNRPSIMVYGGTIKVCHS